MTTDYEAQLHALAAKYTALRKKYDALYTQSREAAKRRQKLEDAREYIKQLEARIRVLESPRKPKGEGE